jgi:signal transduction histidine kinase
VAWNQQQAFIANASHELRAPLTVIRADAEYGLRSGHSSDQIEALKDVVGEVDYMDRMVEDLLLLSRLDANRLKLGIEAVDVVVLFDDVIGEIEKLAFTKKVKVIIGQARGTVLADRSRLRQVLLILLDNALRFSGKNGRVELDVVTTGQVVEISVIDQGPGISPEHIPHLFERFYQVPSDNSETMHGNGLGLSIAKGLVELQGGDIQVDSKVGEGTRFMVRLPSATP